MIWGCISVTLFHIGPKRPNNYLMDAIVIIKQRIITRDADANHWMS